MTINLEPRVIQAPVDLTEQEQQHIDQVILSALMPWYYNDHTVGRATHPDHISAQDIPYMFHYLMMRSANPEHEGLIVDQAQYEIFKAIFARWAEANSVPWSRIYRASFNMSFSAPAEFTLPHIDHSFPHWNWVWYLDTVPNTPTVLWDDSWNITHEIPCVQNQAVAFTGRQHAWRYAPGFYRRRLVVFTFI
jgi:hypothetical protein